MMLNILERITQGKGKPGDEVPSELTPITTAKKTKASGDPAH